MSEGVDGEALYEHAPCGLLVTRPDGTILRVNRTFCTWLGRTPEQLLGLRLQSLLTVGGQIFHQTHWVPLLQMQGSLAEVKLDLLHAEGRRIPMVMNAVVRQKGDDVVHELAAFSARDRHQYEHELLLARERAEALLESELASQRALADTQDRLQLAADAARLYQWAVDFPEGERRYAPEVVLLLGEPVPRPISGVEFVQRIHPDDRERVQHKLKQYLAAGTGRLQDVFRIIRDDGSDRWLAAWGAMRRDSAGEPLGVVGVLQDVTESNRLRTLAEDKVILAEQTLGIVGHDLRNPLAAIQMGAELLVRRPADETTQRAIAQRMLSSLRRANRLIEDLMDFTHTRTGRTLKVSRTPTDVHQVMRDVVAEMAAAHPTRRLQHRHSGDGAVLADADRVAQALGNLISNALTYGEEHSPVTVSSFGLPDSVRLEVHNDGALIDPSLQAILFEPMSRGTSAGHARSVGLGLYIVREIALAHRGDVGYSSDDPTGPTFAITLPRG